MKDFIINKDKAINSLLFVATKLKKADAHKIYKILYFADQKHLIKYGRPIIGDFYVKMKYGPVPSFVRNVVDENSEIVAKQNQYYINPLQSPNLDCLSESDLECLNEAIKEYGNLTFNKLTDKSHDYAYEKAIWRIDYKDIAIAGGADEDILEYIQIQKTNDNLELV